METQDQNNSNRGNQPPHNNRIGAGIVLLVIGGLFLLRETNYYYFPDFLFTWPMILIMVGVYTGVKHGFRGPGWLILIVIGGFFLTDQMDTGLDLHRFLVPAIIISVGLMLILRPKRTWNNGDWGNWHGGRYRRNRNFPNTGNFNQGTASPTGTSAMNEDFKQNSNEDYISANSVFGNVQKIVVSKNFKGGEIVCFMGGAEIDLSQADITGQVVLEISTVMGGAKLIVPPNWEVRSQVSTVMGGMEDKRSVRGAVIDFNKVLIIKGTAFMGGIELRSY